MVTSWDAFTGENFRRGGFLAEDQRYERAREFLQTARELWDSWDDDAVVADPVTGRFLRRRGRVPSSTTAPSSTSPGSSPCPGRPRGTR